MHEFWMAAKVAGLTGVTMLAATEINIEDGRVSVAVAVTCTIFICGIVWWLSSRFQKISDSIEGLRERLERMEDRQTEDED